MPISEATVQSLRQLIDRDAALRDGLQRARSTSEAASLLVPAANQAGLDIHMEDLLAFFAAQIPAAANQSLDDEQLDKVAGGMSYIEKQAASFFSFGLACLPLNSGGNKKATEGRPL